MISNVQVGVGPSIDSPFFCFGLGSCFVAHLKESMHSWGIPYSYNPLGTSFNPISIAQQLRWIFDENYALSPFYQHRGDIHALFAANSFQSTDKEILSQCINNVRSTLLNSWKDSPNGGLIVVSLGTAHAWEMDGVLVNNCHKLPGQLFRRRILSINEIVTAWKKVLPCIPAHIHLVYTVSPVRYTKIGLQENFKGKSVLRLAIEELLELRENSTYFPSYEIITDELRDYSFYESNGTHPNEKAVKVVMERFKTFLSLK